MNQVDEFAGRWRLFERDGDRLQRQKSVLRHTVATLYLQDNPGDLVGLARLLGHDSLNTTMRYTLPTTEVLAERMEGLR
jgi:integrase